MTTELPAWFLEYFCKYAQSRNLGSPRIALSPPALPNAISKLRTHAPVDRIFPSICSITTYCPSRRNMCARASLTSTGRPDRMSHRKWRETKQQPSRARSGHQISCCLVSLHFLCDTDILSGCPVQSCVESFLLSCENFCRNHFPVILSHPRAETRLQGDLVGCRTGSEEN